MSASPHSNPSKHGLWARIVASKVLFISILVHLLFGTGAAIYVVQTYQAQRKLTFKEGPPTISPSTRALEHKISMTKKKSSMSAPAQAKRITTTGLAKVALPDMPTISNATTVMPNRMAGVGGFGAGVGFGTGGSGMGTGGGGGGFMLPRIVGNRCTASARAAAMKASGGDPKCETAILKGLRYLKENQNADGSFGQAYQSSMTGLALLSFLGHCERPQSAEFGPCVRKAIDYLVKAGASDNGKLSSIKGNGWVYEHGIAAYALGEAYIFTKEEAIAPVLKAALKIIVEGQASDGGWQYNYGKSGDSDTSVSGWQIQALKAAHLTDLNIEGVDEAMKKAMGNMLRVQGSKGGFGYTTKGDKWDLTGVGVLCLQIGTGQRGGPVREGLKYLTDDDALEIKYDGKDANLYAWYYTAQACFQGGGSAWTKWNRAFQREVLDNQDGNGSWRATGGKTEGKFHYTGTGDSSDALVYRTSMCILMLEVYYRYLATSRA